MLQRAALAAQGLPEGTTASQSMQERTRVLDLYLPPVKLGDSWQAERLSCSFARDLLTLRQYWRVPPPESMSALPRETGNAVARLLLDDSSYASFRGRNESDDPPMELKLVKAMRFRHGKNVLELKLRNYEGRSMVEFETKGPDNAFSSSPMLFLTDDTARRLQTVTNRWMAEDKKTSAALTSRLDQWRKRFKRIEPPRPVIRRGLLIGQQLTPN